MSAFLIKLWGRNDEEIFLWLPVGNDKKKRGRPMPVKLKWWQKAIARLREVWR